MCTYLDREDRAQRHRQRGGWLVKVTGGSVSWITRCTRRSATRSTSTSSPPSSAHQDRSPSSSARSRPAPWRRRSRRCSSPRLPGWSRGRSDRPTHHKIEEISMYDALFAESITIAGTAGHDRGLLGSPARLRPARRRGRHPPHARLRHPTKEIARNFASHGYNAVVPNLYWRERRARARTTRPRPPAPRAASPTTAWSATWPAPWRT